MNTEMASSNRHSQLKGDPLPWLLEENQPEVRYLTMRDLMDKRSDDSELLRAQEVCYRNGAAAQILQEMNPQGYWVKPGPGYNPKYRGTVWSIIMLAQIGAEYQMDGRIQTACNYLAENNLTVIGAFSVNGTPSGTVDCLQGNLCAALLDLGWEDSHLDMTFEWMARTVTGEGIAPKEEKSTERRFYAYKSGPNFACGPNHCAWGAAKVMLALAKLPTSKRTPLIQRAIQMGVEFLFSIDPATARYPCKPVTPNRSWWKFGFPVFYVTDILQIVEVLAILGYGGDPRLKNAVDLVLSKQDDTGRWPLEYSYQGKTWIDWGETGKANKWVTLRVLRVFKNIEQITESMPIKIKKSPP
jgi:hypothetical protein